MVLGSSRFAHHIRKPIFVHNSTAVEAARQPSIGLHVALLRRFEVPISSVMFPTLSDLQARTSLAASDAAAVDAAAAALVADEDCAARAPRRCSAAEMGGSLRSDAQCVVEVHVPRSGWGHQHRGARVVEVVPTDGLGCAAGNGL